MAYCNGKLEHAITIIEPKYMTTDIPGVPKIVTPERRSEDGCKPNEVPDCGVTESPACKPAYLEQPDSYPAGA